MMSKKKMKNAMILGSSIACSMIAGFAIGCIKTKLMDDVKCTTLEL